MSAYGAYRQGQQAQFAANLTATQIETRAKQERAIAQMEAARRRRQGKAQLSTQRSLMATTGFASDDPTSLSLVSETVGAQTLEELLVLAQGEDSARQMEFEAKQVRQGGKNAMRNAKSEAFGALVGGGMSWYDRYGPGRRTGGGSVLTKPAPKTQSGTKLRAG